jgi:hypothetical protein
MNWKKVDSKEFNRQLSFSKRLEFVTVYDEKTLDAWDKYVAIGSGVGFALIPGKEIEIANVFNNTGVRLCGREAMTEAIRLGGRTVFCFDGFLAHYCESLGFTEYNRAKWCDELAPANWNYERYGWPGVVWLRFDTSIWD